MRRLVTRLGAGPILGLLILSAHVPAGGENVPLHRVPPLVLEAVRARFKDARVTGADKERADGKLVYEVAVQRKGQKIDVTLTPEGAIVLIKKEIAAVELPEPVTRALEERYPGAAYQVVEEVTRVQGTHETVTRYEIDLVTRQRRRVEVQVSVGGAILHEVK